MSERPYNSEICVVPSLKSLCMSATGTPRIFEGTIVVGSQSSLNIRHKDFDAAELVIVVSLGSTFDDGEGAS